MDLLHFCIILAMLKMVTSMGAGISSQNAKIIDDASTSQNAENESQLFNHPFVKELARFHGYKSNNYVPNELDQLVLEWDNYYKEICAKFAKCVEEVESRQTWTMISVEQHREQLAEPLEGIKLTITEFRNATEHLRKGVQNSPELLPQHCYMANQIHSARVEWLLAVAEDADNMANTIESLENYAKNWQFKY